PERVSQGDRAAVDVHAFRIEAELADYNEALRGERLVQLDEIEVGRLDSGPGKKPAHRRHGPNPHHARVNAGDRTGHETAERLGAELAGPLLARDHERGGTVVDPARVACCDRSVLAERGLEPSELLRGRVGPRMLVAADAVDGHHLAVEVAGF